LDLIREGLGAESAAFLARTRPICFFAHSSVIPIVYRQFLYQAAAPALSFGMEVCDWSYPHERADIPWCILNNQGDIFTLRVRCQNAALQQLKQWTRTL
jgi:hypothetical protein